MENPVFGSDLLTGHALTMIGRARSARRAQPMAA